MMHRVLFFLLMALLLLPAASLAEKAILLEINIEQNLDVTGYNLSVVDAQSLSHGSGIMMIELYDSSQNPIYSTGFQPSLYLLSDPPKILNETAVILSLPYREDTAYINIYGNGSLKLSIDVAEELCDNDGVCDSNENHNSCPSDCSVYDRDGLCAGVSLDGGCDPDCPSYLDADCSCHDGICEEWENHLLCSDDCESGSQDGYCDALADGRCDPDCETGDIDCTCPDGICQSAESPETCPQDCRAGSPDSNPSMPLYIAVIILAAAALIVLLKR